MRIAAIADVHGQLDFNLPQADLLLIAGDLCSGTRVYNNNSLERSMGITRNINSQSSWLKNYFKEWLYKQPIDYAICVPGNHDWIFEYDTKRMPLWFGRNIIDREMVRDRKIEWAEDYLVFYNRIKIYGTPVQPIFFDWAYNRSEKQLQRHWDAIPNNIPGGIDILLCHCPPYGILDKTSHPKYPSRRIGSKSLLKRIKEVRPKYVVFGHNHSENGIVEQDGITYVNCSLVNEQYIMDKKPIILEI